MTDENRKEITFTININTESAKRSLDEIEQRLDRIIEKQKQVGISKT